MTILTIFYWGNFINGPDHEERDCRDIDANGILTVTYKVVTSGRTEKVTVTNLSERFVKARAWENGDRWKLLRRWSLRTKSIRGKQSMQWLEEHAYAIVYIILS